MHWLITEILDTQQVHTSLALGIYDIVSEHGVKYFPFNLDSIPFQYKQIIFNILTNPESVRILKKRIKFRKDFYGCISVCRNRNIIRFSGFPGETEPDKFRIIGINTGGFCVKGNFSFT